MECLWEPQRTTPAFCLLQKTQCVPSNFLLGMAFRKLGPSRAASKVSSCRDMVCYVCPELVRRPLFYWLFYALR